MRPRASWGSMVQHHRAGKARRAAGSADSGARCAPSVSGSAGGGALLVGRSCVGCDRWC